MKHNSLYVAGSTAYYMPTPLWPKPQSFRHGNLSCIVDQDTVQWKLAGNATNSQLLQTAIQNTMDLIFAWTNSSLKSEMIDYINIFPQKQPISSHFQTKTQTSDKIDENSNNIDSSQYVEMVTISTQSSDETLDSTMIENYTLSTPHNCTTVCFFHFHFLLFCL